MCLQFAHINYPENAKAKKPFAISQMVIITLAITLLLALAVFIAIVSLIQWSYSKSGAQSFIKSKRAQKYEDVNDNSISSP